MKNKNAFYIVFITECRHIHILVMKGKKRQRCIKWIWSMVVQGDRGYNSRWIIICIDSLIGKSLEIVSPSFLLRSNSQGFSQGAERQDGGHWLAIRNPGRLDTVSFCGVLVYRSRELMEKSLRDTSWDVNAWCINILTNNYNSWESVFDAGKKNILIEILSGNVLKEYFFTSYIIDLILPHFYYLFLYVILP